jgi:hypothetical protein
MTDPAQSAPSLGLATLRIAQAELARGVRETSPNDGERIRVYRAPCVRHGAPLHLGPSPWCAMFASWCVWTAAHARLRDNLRDIPKLALAWDAHEWIEGMSDARIGYRASVAELCDDARATGALRLPNADEYPLPGDLIVYGRDNQNPLHGGHGHVAICERWSPVDGHAVISGNSHDRVARDTWDAGDMSPWGPMLAWIKL